MGHKDLKSLHKIYSEILSQNRTNGWYFSFKVDDGDFETRIDINEDGNCIRAPGTIPLIGYDIFCPDLLDWNRKLIMEFEEEAGKSTGYFHAKRDKGHTEYPNTRDTRRDFFYTAAKFIILKIWESDLKSNLWKRKIQSFLTIQILYPLKN